MIIKRAIVEMAPGDKSIEAGAQPKIDAKPDVDAVAIEAAPGNKNRCWRQRRPAAVSRGLPPTYPRRPPTSVWNPKPSYARIRTPAAIMKRRPTPGVIRVPIPAAVAPEPMATVAVRPPGCIYHRNRRLPAPAIAIDVDPASVRGKRVLKILRRR